jgi:hypothetical protein
MVSKRTSFYEMSSKIVEPDIEDAGDYAAKPTSQFTRWYRSPLFNVVVVGLISFTQPGIWNALNSKLFAITTACSSSNNHRCRRRWTARTLPRQRRQFSDIRYHGLRLLPLRHTRQQVRSEKRVNFRNAGICALLRVIVWYAISPFNRRKLC